jgi:hypothetical protein
MDSLVSDACQGFEPGPSDSLSACSQSLTHLTKQTDLLPLLAKLFSSLFLKTSLLEIFILLQIPDL